MYQPLNEASRKYLYFTNVRKNLFLMSIVTMIMLFVLSLLSKTPPSVPPSSKYGIITLFSKNHLCETIHSCQTYATIPEIKNKIIPLIALYASDVSKKDLETYHYHCPYVQLRPFTVSSYPEYFKDLKNYRFKFPTVASVLPEFKTIMYVDASIRFTAPKNETLTDMFKSMETQFAKTGFRLLGKSFHHNYPVTHPDMYAFFNVTEKQMKETNQFHSGLYFLNNSPAGWKVMNKMIQCALQPKCMAPKGAKARCNYRLLKENKHILCHRFDQSALNMRLIELYGKNETLYYRPSSIVNIVQMSKCSL
uniref:Nucleotide-diphospho-sugar transferase domain-containing protein n=1 Tax=Panagrellus redivivus TaxID=6233 RepID=A0A7E4VTS7_PANRE